VRSRRKASQAITTQASRSNVDVDTMWPIAKTNTDVAAQNAAITCARRRPPNSLATRATTRTATAQASVEATRSPAGVTPKTAVVALATIGVSGGWSTYPHAG
jgi:hypothetical protein